MLEFFLLNFLLSILSIFFFLYRYRDDQPIPSHRYNVQTRGNIIQLTLKQSQQNDTGHYALVAKKLSTNNYSLDDCDNKEIVRKKIRMSVRTSSDNLEEGEPPVFVRRLTDLSVKVGTRTRFLVEIRSSSNPKVIILNKRKKKKIVIVHNKMNKKKKFPIEK